MLSIRVGIGYDIHKLIKGRKLVLGGVKIPHSKGLFGHSDGDALVHAIVDAALGAGGLGDIGDHFSDKEARWCGVSSLLFARETVSLLRKNKWRIFQIDSVLMIERPKLSPFKKAMRESLANAFGVDISRVNVKAKTNEGLGAIGKGRAVAASAVVLLEKR